MALRSLFQRLTQRLLSQLPVAHADVCPLYASGVNPAPGGAQNTAISMASEEVDIFLFRRFAVVFALFELENHGEQVEIEVGFPCIGGDMFSRSQADLHDFQIAASHEPFEASPWELREESWDDHHITHAERRIEGLAYPTWMLWKQRFPSQKKLYLVVRYWCALHDYSGVSRQPFVYVLRTGGLWHGNIGEAIIRVRAAGIPPHAICEATPAGYGFDEKQRLLSWTFRDLDPQQDIGLLLSPGAADAGALGLRTQSILALNLARPPEGTPVFLNGYFRECPRPPWGSGRQAVLLDERSRDTNIFVPKTIRAFSEYEDLGMIGVPLLLSDQTHFDGDPERIPGGWKQYFAFGHVSYRGEELSIEAKLLTDLRGFYAMMDPKKRCPIELPAQLRWDGVCELPTLRFPWMRLPEEGWWDSPAFELNSKWLRDPKSSRHRLRYEPEEGEEHHIIPHAHFQPERPSRVPVMNEAASTGKASPPLTQVKPSPVCLGSLGFVRIEGSSMLPALSPGDVIAVIPLWRRPRPGHIVLLELSGRTVIKRVASVDGEACVLGVEAPYGTFPLSMLKGRALFAFSPRHSPKWRWL